MSSVPITVLDDDGEPEGGDQSALLRGQVLSQKDISQESPLGAPQSLGPPRQDERGAARNEKELSRSPVTGPGFAIEGEHRRSRSGGRSRSREKSPVGRIEDGGHGEDRGARRDHDDEPRARRDSDYDGRDGGRDRRVGDQGGSRPVEPKKLFIGKLSFDATEEDIRHKFSKVGEVVSARIVKDRDTGKSKGFGFVEFADAADAEHALNNMKAVEIAGRVVILDRAGQGRDGGGGGDRGNGGRDSGRDRDSRNDGMEPKKLFIGHLSPDATEDEVRDKFSKVGEIASVRIIKDHDSGQSKGFGFIEFVKSGDAAEAIEAMQGTEIAGRECRIERVASKGVGKGGARRGGRGYADDSRSRSIRRRDGGRDGGRDSGRRGGYDRYGGNGGARRGPRGYADDSRSRTPPPRRRRGGPPDERRRGYPPEGRGGREQRRDSPSRSASRPNGVPSKAKAIQAARRALEDADESNLAAANDFQAAESSLKKREVAAKKSIVRRISDLEKVVQADLAEQVDRADRDAQAALQDALVDSEIKLREELLEKTRELKKTYATKTEDEGERIKKEYSDKAASEEKELNERAKAKIEKEQARVEEEEAPFSSKEAFTKTKALAKEKEELLIAAKRRLETLTGQKAVLPPRRREAHSGQDRGDDRERDRLPRRKIHQPSPPRKDLREDDEYSDSDYSDEEEVYQKRPASGGGGVGSASGGARAGRGAIRF